MVVVVTDVTPDMARRFLVGNVDNRKVRKQAVAEYAASMTAGTYALHHQGIAFDHLGKLLDGQHRLLAIVRSGVTVRMPVARNVPASSYVHIDEHRPRTVADRLKIAKPLGETVGFIARLLTGQVKPSHEVIDQIAGTIAESFAQLTAGAAGQAKIISSAPFKAAALTRGWEHGDMKYVSKLYHDMLKGKFDELPPVANALLGQVLRGMAGTDQYQIFARAYVVFNKECAQNTRLLVKEPRFAIEGARQFWQGAFPGLVAVK